MVRVDPSQFHHDLLTGPNLPGATLLGLGLPDARVGPFLHTTSPWWPATVNPRRPVLLDAYCGLGGAGVGYHTAGFAIIGVDSHPQPNYPFPLIRGDALDVIACYGASFDVIHTSPPCQGYSPTAVLRGKDHPRLIEMTRQVLLATGRPYVIENVASARHQLREPVTLCMAAWGRRLYRHRLFESNVALLAPPHPDHRLPQAKLGRAATPDQMYQAVGHFPQVREDRHQMEMGWAHRDGIAQAIPPVFSDYLGRQLLGYLIDCDARQPAAS